ncbi:hypothetical protein [Confluentibacter sediminis]|uniref:hypothetical protein n=1 Tax=Confluentibacter sediminis TaxID=2219045 RepID=UPI000DABD65A|nr:hypothetical protein [Confluentibacter sediminis]
MKKLTIIFFSVFTMILSCKNEVQTKAKDTSNKNQQVELDKQKADNLNKDQLLTKTQFNNFFPEYLGSHKRYNIFVLASEALATASYGDFSNTFNYSLADGIKNSAVIKNFELSYNSELKGPEGTEYIKKERDGHKTIAFLQPKINRYNIEFTYNNRFKLVIEGSEHPDLLWKYIKKEDLQKLNKLN